LNRLLPFFVDVFLCFFSARFFWPGRLPPLLDPQRLILVLRTKEFPLARLESRLVNFPFSCFFVPTLPSPFPSFSLNPAECFARKVKGLYYQPKGPGSSRRGPRKRVIISCLLLPGPSSGHRTPPYCHLAVSEILGFL